MDIGSPSSGIATFAFPRLTMLGDSRTANGASTAAFLNIGIQSWLRALSRQRFRMDLTDVYATSGFTTQQIIDTWLGPVTASSASACIVLASTNDRTGGFTVAQSIANLSTIRDRLLTAGKKVIFIAETPRGDTTYTSVRLTGTTLQNHLQVHQWLLSQAAMPGVYVADPWPQWIASASSTSLADAVLGYTLDGLHPKQIGAYYLAQALLPVINAIFPPAENLLPATNYDAYDATNNPRGVMSQNPMTTGTGGTINAPGAGAMSGSLAASHVADLASGTGLTVTLSKVTLSGAEWQQIAVSGTPTSAGAALTIRQFGASTTSGDVIDASAEFQVDAGQTGLGGVTLTAANNSINYQDCGGTAMAYPTDAISGVLRVPQFTATATANTTQSIYIPFLQNVAASATLRFRRMNMRRVIP